MLSRSVIRVPIVASSLFGALLAAQPGNAEPISGVTDVARLVTIVTSWDAARELAAPGVAGRGVKDVRTSAFARLGELATAKSLAAVLCIESDAKSATREWTARFDRWSHPAWHFADFREEQKVAMLNVGGGLTYTIVRDSGLLGDDDWFLLRASASYSTEWEGPWLIPRPAASDARTLNLVFSEGKGILVAFTKSTDAMLEALNPVAAGAVPEIRLEGHATLVSAKEIQQDLDGDGRTDLEEERLGLDAHNVDSDGDGLGDRRDSCPDYAPRPEDDQDEDVKILQKAIFATFGLSGSRNLILVGEGSRRIQAWGYKGTILYGKTLAEWGKNHAAGMWVNWRITSKEETSAEVDISDAGGGQAIHLRKISGEWYVIKRTLGPVS